VSLKLEALNDELGQLLGQLSAVDRLVVLSHAIVEDEATVDCAIAGLITVASIMARRLPATRRAALAFHMTSEASALGAKWN
jgi:hypothetical protein